MPSGVYKRIKPSHLKGKKLPKEWVEKLRLSHMGKIQSPETIRRKILATTGKKRSEEFKAKTRARLLGIKRPEISGSKNGNWKGGVTALNKNIRTRFEYVQWRSQIFIRDKYTCVLCPTTGATLHVDHYPKPFAQILREYNIKSISDAIGCVDLWDMNNGRTLCVPCHEKTETYKGKNINKKQYAKN